MFFRSESEGLTPLFRQQRFDSYDQRVKTFRLLRSGSRDLTSSIRQQRRLYRLDREGLAHPIRQRTQLSRSESNNLAPSIRHMRHD